MNSRGRLQRFTEIFVEIDGILMGYSKGLCVSRCVIRLLGRIKGKGFGEAGGSIRRGWWYKRRVGSTEMIRNVLFIAREVSQVEGHGTTMACCRHSACG